MTVILILFSIGYCTQEEFTGTYSDCSELGNCNKVTKCIRKNNELWSDVLNSE